MCLNVSADHQNEEHEHDDSTTGGDRKDAEALRLSKIFEKSDLFSKMKEEADGIFQGFTTTKDPPLQSIHYPTSFSTQVGGAQGRIQEF